MAKIGLFLLKDNRPNLGDILSTYRRLMAIVGSTPLPSPSPGPSPVPRAGHIPTRLEDGRIWTPEGIVPEKTSDAIRHYWPQNVWTDAARVSYYESNRWDNEAVLDTRWRADGRCGVRYWFSDEVGWATTEYSIGLFQINSCAHGGDFNLWRDHDRNAKKGAELYAGSGWRPWTVTARRLGLLED